MREFTNLRAANAAKKLWLQRIEELKTEAKKQQQRAIVAEKKASACFEALKIAAPYCRTESDDDFQRIFEIVGGEIARKL